MRIPEHTLPGYLGIGRYPNCINIYISSRLHILTLYIVNTARSLTSGVVYALGQSLIQPIQNRIHFFKWYNNSRDVMPGKFARLDLQTLYNLNTAWSLTSGVVYAQGCAWTQPIQNRIHVFKWYNNSRDIVPGKLQGCRFIYTNAFYWSG